MTPVPTTAIPRQRPPSNPAATWGLVEAAKAGDVEALAELYRLYSDAVFRYAYFKLHNRTLAEDIAAEVWLRVTRNIGRITWVGSDFGAWLNRITQNLIKDYFKSGRFQFEWCVAEAANPNGVDPSPEGEVEATVMGRLENVVLLAALDKLTPEQAAVIRLRFLSDLSVPETARLMGRTEGATKALTYRAVNELSRLMGGPR